MNKIMFRALVAAAVLPAFIPPLQANAQEYPTRPVKIITPSAAGGTTDLLSRIMANKLTEMYKTQQVIVENRASATGVLGGEVVANSPPDGYTLLLAYHQHTWNKALGVPMSYDPVNSFTPIT